MTFDEVFARLQQPGLDAEQRMLVTVETTLEMHAPRVRAACHAAAVPHSFNAAILARLLGVDLPEAEDLTRELAGLSFVETFPLRGGWNVHKRIRLAMRLKLQRDDPERFKLLSERAGACSYGDQVVNRVEAIYHGLSSDPDKTAGELERTYLEWFRSGRLEALHMLATALEELRAFPLDDTARAGALVFLGWIWLYRYPLDETEKLAREALRIIPPSGKPTSLADAHHLLGQVLDWQGKTKDALPHLQTAQQLLTEALAADPANVEIKRDLAIAHILIARNSTSIGAVDRALEQYDESRRILLELIDLEPYNPTWKREISVTYYDVGKIYEDQKNFPLALKAFQTDRRIAASLADAEPENPDRKRDLAGSYNNIGRLFMDEKKFSEALEEYQIYESSMQGLIAVDPSNLDWQRELAIAMQCIGNAYNALERSAEAIEKYQASRRILEGLTELDPRNAGWKRDLSMVDDRMGRAYRSQNLFPEALASFGRSQGVLEALLAMQPDNIEWLRGLSFVYHQIGRVHEAQGDTAGALASFEKDLAIAQRIAALQPDNETRKDELRVSQEAVERARKTKIIG
jgi:tetratricopeptide (TPR) repeat protein